LEDAKEKKDHVILKAFRDMHREARRLLEEANIKDRIREYDRIHDQRNQNKDYCSFCLLDLSARREVTAQQPVGFPVGY
jgi:hypothetical protein